MKIQTGWRKSPSIRVVLAANSVLQLALELPMRHEYGNGVAIFTRDGDTARDFAYAHPATEHSLMGALPPATGLLWGARRR
jgi:hypothetical protein